MRVYTNLSPFAADIAGGALRTGDELMRRVLDAGFHAGEINLELLLRTGGRDLPRGLDFHRTALHFDFTEFDPGATPA